MKVELNSTASTQLPVERAAKPATTTHVETAPQVASDRTTLSSDQTVQALANKALQSPEVRQSTVSALRQSVSSGTYQADATRTASALAAHES